MGLRYSNKINKIRTFALSLVFIGILIMYVGIFFKEYPVVMVICMILGLLAVIASTVVYFFIGMLSTKAVPVVCLRVTNQQRFSAELMHVCIVTNH